MDVALYVRESGSGIPLVLLHAFPLSSAMWQSQREGLSDICQVITPDLRGFGGTPLSVAQPSLDVSADDVARMLDALGLDSVAIGGLSMGGYVAMALLRRHGDRVRALVLADTKAAADPEQARDKRERMADLLSDDPQSTVLLDEVLPNLVGKTTTEKRAMIFGRVKALVQAAPAPAVAWAQRAMAARPDSFDTLRGFAGPALVIRGEEDALASADDMRAMADALPNAQLVTIPEAGHLSAVEAPDDFNKAVRVFVSGL